MATPQTNAANQPQPIAQPNVKNQVTPPAPQPLTTEQQATIQASGLKPGTLQTGPVTGTTPGGQGLAPAEQTFQAVTTLPDATAGRNAAAAAVRPPGTVFDPQTGTYKDPTSGSTYAGSATGKVNAQGQEIMQAPPVPGMGGLRFTTDGSQAVTPGQLMPPASLNGQNPIKVVQGVPDITKTMDANTKSLIDSGLAPSDTGVLTTDNYTLASATLGTAISTMASNPLGAALSSSTDATNYLIQQNLQQYQELSAGAANPQLDPVFKLLLQHQADIRQNMVSQIQDIHAQTETQLTAQAQQNKALEGQARAAVNAAGQVGSMVGEGFIAAQMQNNQAALQSIVQSESKAINDAQAAYEQQDMDTAMKMADLADKRRTQAHDLLSENASLSQNMEQMSMQRQQVALQTQSQVMQLKQQGMKSASDVLGVLAKQNLAPSAIPDSVWQEVSADSGGAVSTDMAKMMYTGSLKDEQSASAKDFAANTVDFYKAAALIKDPNAVLYRPNQDGTFTSIKRSEMQTVPNYDTFQTTRNGKNYATYINKDDPTAKPVEIALGDVEKKTQMTQDAFGNTLAITDNGDGTFSSRKILDFAGNPVGQQSVVDTQNHLDSTGLEYSQNDGTPPWSPPDGTVHLRGGKPAPECGQYVNDILGTHFPDSIAGKIKECDPSIGVGQGQTPPTVGMAVVTAEAAGTGHVAIISEVYKNDKGQTMYKLNESNYKKNAQHEGVVTSTRSIPADDPLIRGFAPPQKDLSAEDGPPLPKDNGMAWKVKAPADMQVNTHIPGGTVTDVQPVSTFKDGSPMYSVSVKSDKDGVIHTYSGLAKSELRIGSSWDHSTSSPPIGTTGSNGYGVSMANHDGSPIKPMGSAQTPISQRVANGESWGQYNFIPATPQVQSRYNTILGQVSKGTITLDSALSRMKTDPILGQITPDTYLGDFQDAAQTGTLSIQNKRATALNTEERLQNTYLMEARRIVPAAQFSSDPSVNNYRATVALMPKMTGIEKGYVAKDVDGNPIFDATGNPTYDYSQGNASSDLDLVDTYVRMTTGGQSGVQEAQINAIKDNQALPDKLSNIVKNTQYGGFLTPQSRKQILDLAHSVASQQESTFKNVAGAYQKQLSDYFAKKTDPVTGLPMKSPIDLTTVADVNAFTGTIVSGDGTSQSNGSPVDANGNPITDNTQPPVNPVAPKNGDSQVGPDGQKYTFDGINWKSANQAY